VVVLTLAVLVGGSVSEVVSHRNVCVQADAGKREGCGRKKGRTIREKIANAKARNARKPSRADDQYRVTSVVIWLRGREGRGRRLYRL